MLDNTPLHYRVRLLLTELVRDWSVEGDEERKQSYEPLIKELPAERCHVLVPGCGTGRLAYDVAVRGHDVEANDFDIMKRSPSYNHPSGPVFAHFAPGFKTLAMAFIYSKTFGAVLVD
mmetsp:Transcript_20158/g.16856  ORF Transcript_20158/g.16856 Transcript_20158/m.16856 type:complete len:118 (+) Transcript_20158:154-507(+)